jgi:cytochrome c-type biogenesis protein CcmH
LSKPFHKQRLGQWMLMGFFALAACSQSGADRYTYLANEMICICGCNQLLGGCTMINCPSSEPMRKELRGYLDQGYDDNRILATFVDKYGGRVRSSPPTDDWFNLSAWIMPFFALFGGGLLVVYFLKTWKAATSQQPAPAAIDPSKYQAEIEEELRRLTPED